jgi:hypothetical protein
MGEYKDMMKGKRVGTGIAKPQRILFGKYSKCFDGASTKRTVDFASPASQKGF